MKHKIIKLLITFLVVFSPLALNYDYVTSDELKYMPKMGAHSCYIIQKFEGRPTGRSKICSATVLSNHQISIDQTCLYKTTAHDTRHGELNCLSGSVKTKIPMHTKYKNGVGILTLKTPLPIVAPKLERQKTIKDESFKKCYLKSGNKYINLKPLDSNTRLSNDGIIKNRILNKTDIGGAIYCENSSKESFIVGVLDEGLKIKPVAELEKDNVLFNQKETLEQFTEDINQKCVETGLCLKDLSIESKELTHDMLTILYRLNKDYQDSQKITAIEVEDNLDQLAHSFEEIRLACNKLVAQLQQKDDDIVETGFWSGAMGLIEDKAISLIELVHDDFLLNEFKDVKIIGENLSDNEIERIFNNTKKKHPDLNNIDLIKKATLAFTDTIVTKISAQMDVNRLGEEKYLKFLATTRKDLEECLAKADSRNKVLECSDKFAKTASVKIAEIELENQITENFENLFDENNKEEYITLKTSAQDTYYRCITKFYYESNLNEDNSNAAKGCVLQAVITAYNRTKNLTVAKYLQDAGVKEQEVPAIINSVISQSKSCHNYDIIGSSNSNSPEHFKRFTSIEIDDFKDYLDDCIERLSLVAGRVITEKTVKNHKQINDIISSSSEVDKIVESVAIRLYDSCIAAQEIRKDKKKDANACRDVITAITTLEVAKVEVLKSMTDLTKDDLGLRESLSKKITNSLNACSKDLEASHLKALAKTKDPSSIPNERQTLDCLSDAVLIIVNDVTEQSVKKTILKDPMTAEFQEVIFKNSEIIKLPSLVSACFKEKFQKAQTIDQFTGLINKTKETCQFEAEKHATAAVAPLILEAKLAQALRDSDAQNSKGPDSAALRIAKEYTLGEKGLIARLKKAKNKDELAAITNAITVDLTIKGAQVLIPNLTLQMLGDFPLKTRNDITKKLLSTITSCLQKIKSSGDKQKKEIDFCINSSTLQGYQEISGQIISKNIIDVLAGDQKMATNMMRISKERFIKCAKVISLHQSSADYKKTINQCMIDEVAFLSYELPREAIILYAPAADTQTDPVALRSKLKEIEDFYLLRSKNIPTRTGDFLADSHYAHMSCIANIRYELKRANETDMTKVQMAYAKCTDKVEENIKSGIVEIFAKKHANGSDNRAAMHNLGNTLIQLTSKQKEVGVEVRPPSEAFAQMHLVGEKFKTACTLSPEKCEEVSRTTLAEITKFKNENENATGDELFNKFINSKVMDFVITSEISTSLKSELSNGMKDYFDEEGLLKSAIDSITSITSIDGLLKSSQGPKAKEMIVSAIKNNSIDKIMENAEFRKVFALTLTNRIENDSFIDQLIYGIIQPMVKKERHTSRGVFGIFKNPKVALGRLLGIVKGRDFDWKKIRETNDGKRAREIFAKEVFAPIVEGIELDQQPAQNTKKYKNRLEELTTQIEDHIVKAVTSM